MIQAILLVLGGLSIWMTQQRNETIRKYACFVGLLVQPFWFYESYNQEQWGIFLLTIAYTYSWWLGYKNYWTIK